jgi:hypothetical protein
VPAALAGASQRVLTGVAEQVAAVGRRWRQTDSMLRGRGEEEALQSLSSRRAEWLARPPSAVNEHAQEHPTRAPPPSGSTPPRTARLGHGRARGLRRDPSGRWRMGSRPVPVWSRYERGGDPVAWRPRGWTVNEIPSTPSMVLSRRIAIARLILAPRIF